MVASKYDCVHTRAAILKQLSQNVQLLLHQCLNLYVCPDGVWSMEKYVTNINRGNQLYL